MAAPLPVPTDADPSFAELLAARPQLAAHAADGLMLEEVPLARIAAAVGTPTWVYSAGTLRRRARALTGALAGAGLAASVHFAVKANTNLAVLRTLAAEGPAPTWSARASCWRARAAGIPPSAIVFSGVGKTERELRLALAEDIVQINAESAEEAEVLSALASDMGRVARVALRVNPDVDARTHAKITTGKSENKFGVAIADAPALYARMAATARPRAGRRRRAYRQPDHPGHGGLSRRLCRASPSWCATCAREGLPVERVDCGGGLGIPYRDEPAPAPEALAGAIKATLGDLGLPVMLEPGRWIGGPAGVLLASVVLQKRGTGARASWCWTRR